MWFHRVFGFPEPSIYENVRSKFTINVLPLSLEKTRFIQCYENGPLSGGDIILQTVPQPNNDDDTCNESRQFFVGTFDTPSVMELRRKLEEMKKLRHDKYMSNTELKTNGLTFHHIIGDASKLHCDINNAGAVFQVASQFNALEMTSPNRTPDNGITDYWYDGTQGPACAMACPAATLYRNYFVNEHGQGGREGKQLDLLKDVGLILDNAEPQQYDRDVISGQSKYWKMQNGYALPVSDTSMSELTKFVSNKGSSKDLFISTARDALRVGVHWETEVDAPNHHTVTQVFCSAVPVSYDFATTTDDWKVLATLVLDGLYEATLAIASILSYNRSERVPVYITFVGGGVFGNQPEWIVEAIQHALNMFIENPIDVYLVHHRNINHNYSNCLPEIGP